MADDLFDDNAQEENSQEVEGESSEETPEKIKIGEEEYDPDEAASLLKVAKDIKEKHGDPDKFVSDWGRSKQELGELRKKLEEYEKEKEKETVAKSQAGEQLTPEEQADLVKKQAKQFGLLTKEEFKEELAQEVTNILEGRKVLRTVQRFEKQVNPYKDKSLPPFKAQDMLEYMSESGIKDPQVAYDVRYKDEIGRWKEQQLQKAKGRGLTTEESSTAGRKEPPILKRPKTFEEMEEMTRAALNREL